jgi:hypothetical protein
LTGYQYIDLFRAGWQLKLARSIHFRLEQLEVPVPKGLRAFMEAQESEGGIQPKTLRFDGKNFDAQADYFVYRRGGLFWDYINAEITAVAVRGFFKASAEGPIFLEGQVRSGGLVPSSGGTLQSGRSR